MSFFQKKHPIMRSAVILLIGALLSGVVLIKALKGDEITASVHLNLSSDALDKNKDIFVHLPRGYDADNTQRAYPVLYVLNRAENFEIARQVTDFLASKGNIPSMIVVGVPHSGNSRVEYKPYETDNPETRRPAVDNLRAFFKTELIPFVDETYNTKPSRILVGHSLAGLFTTDVFLNDPDLFNAYIALSPSYHHGPAILNAAEQFMKRGGGRNNTVFYSNLGGDEFYKIVDQYRMMQSVFKAHAPNTVRWTIKKADNNSHRIMPLLGLYDGLVSIYAGYNLSMPQFREQRYQGIINHYKKLSDEMGHQLQPTKDDLESIRGYFANPDRANDTAVAANSDAYVKDADKLLQYYYTEE